MKRARQIANERREVKHDAALNLRRVFLSCEGKTPLFLEEIDAQRLRGRDTGRIGQLRGRSRRTARGHEDHELSGHLTNDRCSGKRNSTPGTTAAVPRIGNAE